MCSSRRFIWVLIATSILITQPMRGNQPDVSFNRLPLVFEENHGQAPEGVDFLAHGRGYTLYLSPDGVILSFSVSQQEGSKPPASENIAGTLNKPHPIQRSLRLQFRGAHPLGQGEGLDEMPGKANYFIGNDPQRWRTNVPTYRKVRYTNVYPGVDLVYYGNQRELEFDFIVSQGADPAQIALAFDGANTVTIDDAGDIFLEGIRIRKPAIYQRVQGNKIYIPGRYVVDSGGQIRFDIEPHDPSLPLVIDPVVSHSTYLGGSSGDYGVGIAVDSAGSAYVVGHTLSVDFPTVNPGQPLLSGGLDFFVAKFNPQGSALVYSTYLGGSAGTFEAAGGIAIDDSGNAYITGRTDSPDFPTTQGTFDRTFHGGIVDAFATKLSPAGDSLVYSTYLGGSGEDHGQSIAVDGAGSAYAMGLTTSLDFPAVNAVQAMHGGGVFDVYVTKLNTTGSALVYSTYLGGNQSDIGFDIATDTNGSAHIVGSTASTTFPTASAFQSSCALDSIGTCVSDAFITKLGPAGSTFVYSTYLGGSRQNFAAGDGGDVGHGVAVDTTGNAYITGFTASLDFPTMNPLQSTRSGPTDAFVSKFDPIGTLVYSTYLGGTGTDSASSIDVDTAGSPLIVGGTTTADFPTVDPIPPNNGLMFVAKLHPSGAPLSFSTLFGADSTNDVRSIAMDPFGNAHILGNTSSAIFPVTPGVLQSTYGGGGDAFVMKICTNDTCDEEPPPQPAPTITSVLPISGMQGETITNFTVNGTNFQTGATLSFAPDSIVVNSTAVTPTQIVASITIESGAATGTRDVIVTNPDSQQNAFPAAFTVNPLVPPPPPPTPQISLIPLGASLEAGQTHTVHATAEANGMRIVGVRIDFAITGANSTTGSAITNAIGVASFSYSGNDVGQDTIFAHALRDGIIVSSNEVSVDWLPPAPAVLDITLPANGVQGKQNLNKSDLYFSLLEFTNSERQGFGSRFPANACYYGTVDASAEIIEKTIVNTGLTELALLVFNSSIGVATTGNGYGDVLLKIGSYVTNLAVSSTPPSITTIKFAAEESVGFLFDKLTFKYLSDAVAPPITDELTKKLLKEEEFMGIEMEGSNAASDFHLAEGSPLTHVSIQAFYNSRTHYLLSILRGECNLATGTEVHEFILRWELNQDKKTKAITTVGESIVLPVPLVP